MGEKNRKILSEMSGAQGLYTTVFSPDQTSENMDCWSGIFSLSVFTCLFLCLQNKFAKLSSCWCNTIQCETWNFSFKGRVSSRVKQWEIGKEKKINPTPQRKAARIHDIRN